MCFSVFNIEKCHFVDHARGHSFYRNDSGDFQEFLYHLACLIVRVRRCVSPYIAHYARFVTPLRQVNNQAQSGIKIVINR